jgi:hypothetical protein
MTKFKVGDRVCDKDGCEGEVVDVAGAHRGKRYYDIRLVSGCVWRQEKDLRLAQ